MISPVHFLFQFSRECFFVLNALLDFPAMVKVEGKRGVNVGQRQIVLFANFIRTFAHAFMPDDDVLDRDPAPRYRGTGLFGASVFFVVNRRVILYLDNGWRR